jgi:hypothetical protein
VAPTSTKSTGTKLQTWLPISLAEQLKAQADAERRSVSGLIKLCVEDRLRGSQERRP